MGDLNDRSTVGKAAGILWANSADRVFAVGPVSWQPIDGKAARHIYFMIASGDATGEAHFDRIQLEDGVDHGQMRGRFIEAIEARGPCDIRDFDNEANFIKFCDTTWPGETTARLRASIEAQETEDDVDLAAKFPNLRKQIEAFVLDRAKEALASSRIMNSSWREMLETISPYAHARVSR
jgi:hypothetical protein